MITCEQPTSFIMSAATSSVCAPCFDSVAQFCAATRMFEPSSRSATVFNAVKTGAITISQWLALATSGFSASAVSTASLSSLNIFQFPAITGLRIRSEFSFLQPLVVVALCFRLVEYFFPRLCPVGISGRLGLSIDDPLRKLSASEVKFFLGRQYCVLTLL